MDSTKTVVIIGAGFFGLSAANRLAKSGKNLDIKLISPSKYTYFLISSVRVAVQNDPKGTIHPIEEILDKSVQLILDEVVNFDDRSVQLRKNVELKFDVLIIATGAKWNHPVGSTNHFKDDYVNYFRQQHEKIEKAKRIVLFGGGFNNIELVGEMLDRYEDEMINGTKSITLVHSKNLLLPDDGSYGHRLRKEVTEFLKGKKALKIILDTRAEIIEDGTKVKLVNGKNDGQVLEADLVIHHTGVVPSVPNTLLVDMTNEKGFIKVKETLQTVNHPHIFAIGDVCDFDYKGLVYRGRWLSTVVQNTILVLTCGSNVSEGKLAKTPNVTGLSPAIVSVGSTRGFGQFPISFLGTFRIPCWLATRKKSKNLAREYAKDILGQS